MTDAGLCGGTRFDTKYSWTWDFIDGRHAFRGYTGTMLRYVASEELWRLEHPR